MFGLIALALILVWAGVSFAIARWIGKKIPKRSIGIVVTVILIPLLFVLPLADEIIGKFQFDKLCREAEEVKIYGSIPVGEELYTSDGKWRLGISSLPLEETKRVLSVHLSLLRDESIGPNEIEAAIPIRVYERRIYNRRTNEILASYRQYATSGGWLSRNLGNPQIVRDQCFPPASGLELKLRILPFEKSSGGPK